MKSSKEGDVTTTAISVYSMKNVEQVDKSGKLNIWLLLAIVL